MKPIFEFQVYIYGKQRKRICVKAYQLLEQLLNKIRISLYILLVLKSTKMPKGDEPKCPSLGHGLIWCEM